MRIVVTGGTGLIGRALVDKLTQDQHEVIILSRQPEKHTSKLPKSINLVRWDSRSTSGWAHYIDGADAVINLAGENIAGNNFYDLLIKRLNAAQKETITHSRINAGKALVAAIEIAKVKPTVLIQASAVGYYGDRKNEMLTEESPPGTDFFAKICLEWETSTIDVEKFSVRRVIIRTAGVVLTTQGGSLPFMMLPFKFFVGGPIGNGQQWFSWIHILDEVNAIKFLIDSVSAHGPYNLSAPELLSNRDFSKTLGKILRRPSAIPLPEFALKILFGEKSNILFSSQRQTPSRLLKSGYKFLYPNLSQALTDVVQNKR
jgi:uncharacterized protein (TIGR01777 family)